MNEASERLTKMNNLNYLNDADGLGLETEEKNSKKLLNNLIEPSQEDQEMKLSIFKEHLLSQVKNVTTPELLTQIVEIINSTYIDEIRIRNETGDESEENHLCIKNIETNLIELSKKEESLNSVQDANFHTKQDTEKTCENGKYKLILY